MINNISVEKLIIRPTRITPLVYFDPNRGLLELRGRSSPENAINFYHKLLTALDKYSTFGNRDITANFKYEYFNTSSSKCVFDVFKKLLKIRESGHSININWYYEEMDEDMLEAGEDYSDLLGVEFNYIETEY